MNDFFKMGETELAPIIELVAARIGISTDLFKRSMRFVYCSQLEGQQKEQAVMDKEYTGFLKHLGELERKAARYDLLIGEEKARAEEMAGK